MFLRETGQAWSTGIHFKAVDLTGGAIGRIVGCEAYNKAQGCK